MTASRIVIAAFAGLWSVSAFAQIPVQQTNPTNTTNGQVPQGPVSPGQTTGPRNQTTGGQTGVNGNRGSTNQGDPNDPNAVNGANQPSQGQDPQITDDPNATPEQKASAEYAGPAVLSRGISASEPMNPKNVKFTPTVGLEFVENSGLTGVQIQQNGKLGNQISSGIQLSYGVTGSKVYKQDTFSLSFAGDLYHYAQASGLDGTDNQLALTWQHKLSKHLKFGFKESLQEYNRNNLLTSGANFINSGVGTTLVTATPTTEVFDGRVITAMTQGDITWQQSARLSINLTGSGFLTRRASTALYGDTGSQAGADVAYRITRRQTIGTYYSFTHFDYNGLYGGSDINTVGFTYSIALNPRTQIIARLGASRLETTALQTIALDPVIALLLGTQATVEATYAVRYVPDINVQFRHKVSNLNFSASYSRGVTPGNGIILTSIRQSGSAGVNYKAMRHWNLASTVGYDALSGSDANGLRYSSVFFGGSVYRTIHRNLEWHTRVDFHHYTFDNTGFLRNSTILSTGIVWTPEDVLNRPW